MLLVIAAALAVTVRQSGLAVRAFENRSVPDHVTGFETRFSELKKSLRGAGTVGYLGDRKPKDLQSVMAFMLTQYALAPVVVEQGRERERVVGNYFSDPPTSEELRALKLEPVRDFGNGVVLYRRVP